MSDFDTATARRWVALAAERVHAERDALTALDAAIGDGDHGANLDRGFTAAQAALDEGDATTPGAVLGLVGRTMISKVGGASGPLYGTLFRVAGKTLADAETADGAALLEALRGGLAGITRLGKAQPGEKTLVDALTPALDALGAALDEGSALPDAARRAAAAAREGAEATVAMEAHKGRASYLGPRSVGTADPGATSSALVVEALADALAG